MTNDLSTDAPPRYALISAGLADLVAQNPTVEGAVKPHLTYDGEGFRVRHLSFDAGAVLPEHSAPDPVVIIVADGRVRFDIEGKQFEVSRGAIIYAGAGVPHVVHALEASRLILTLVG